MASVEASQGYDPIALAAATEKVVVDGNKRKYVQLGRALRFYGGTSSATEVGCNLRCKFCFSDKPVWKPRSTGGDSIHLNRSSQDSRNLPKGMVTS